MQGLADFARVNGLLPSSRVLSAAVRPATVSEAEDLRIAPGADLATQLTFNQANRPIELTVQVYRGDRYRFRASITNQP
ncbi:GntR family transcriptional regulator [Rhizomonospora bruguierae]|uniref:hypothetical protein n=1 Tax=Rhizomonospora bruguierae TaxID=1581705 RepID=UPI0020BD9011|nr:hypothetical protein [Micromonospora sp. NBRC 107566]